MYHPAQRTLQQQFDTVRLADRLEDVQVHHELTPAEAQFIARRDMFFLATCDPSGQPTSSIKAGAPGFVQVVDPRTLLFPWYDGNGMFLSAGNIVTSPKVGILFVDFERQRRLRLEGTAELVRDPAAMQAFPGAQFLARVAVTRVYPNCPRYIPRYQLVAPSEFVPEAGRVPPVPDWKRASWAADVLPASDRTAQS